ncbi:MAG TPA: endolytic transglycosylase MltG [Longimicrobiales bacterium]|nr:endolytic transglycosylase MltG [Longimicrobiales bacterium]
MTRARTLAAVLLVTAAACSPAPSGPTQRIHVPPGAAFSQVADTLSARGIIRTKPLFKLYARITRSQSSIKPGTYGFRRGERWDKILGDLRAGRILKDRFVIPEGWSLDRIAARMARFIAADSSAILDTLLDPATAKRAGVPGPTMEGYLYPATYEFALDLPLDTIVTRLVARYRQVWTPERRARADSIGMSEREVVTLASIVEKEAKQRAEMPTIASVYHNRLRIRYPLQADPTVQYALGSHRERLLYADIRRVKSNPYNTYEIRGLPPGPIGSPSDAAIDAVLQPANTQFLYFVAMPDGTHVFTNSLAEHNRAKRAARAAWAAVQNSAAPANK